MAETVGQTVVWERLRLQGFGRHRDLELELGPGLNHWVAPNEAGKTTALLGLVGTLWGVRHLQDREGLSWGRFRAWSGGPHRGEVQLRRGTARFTVSRDFENHHVRVLRNGDDGDELLLEGSHNPQARRERSPYLGWLRSELSLTTPELVLSTFVIAQGAWGTDAHRLGDEVQALLAGAGGSTYQDAGKFLEDSLRQRTRQLRGLAPVFSSDGRKDQLLEQAEARLHELRQAIEGGRAEADAFESAQEAMRLAQTQREEARTLSSAAADELETVRVWGQRRDEVMRLQERHSERARELRAAEALADELAGAQARLQTVEPDLAQAPEDLDARLEAWERAAAAVEAQSAREATVRAERQRSEEEVRARLTKLTEDLAALGEGWPPAVTLRKEGPAGGEGQAVAQLGPSARSAAEALRDLTAAAGRWRQRLAELRTAQARLHEVVAALAPLRVFDEVSQEQIVVLRGYQAERAAMDERAAGARQAMEDLRRQAHDHEQRFASVWELPSEVAAALHQFAEQVEAPDRSGAARGWGATALLLAFGLGGPPLASTLGWSLAPWWPWAAGGAAALLWFVALPRRAALRRARARLDRLAAEGLPGAEGDDELRLERGRRRQAFEAQQEDVARVADAVSKAEHRWEQVQAQVEAFHRSLPELADADVDLGAAYLRFEGLQAKRSETLAQLRMACAAMGLDPARAQAQLLVSGEEELPTVVHDETAATSMGADGQRLYLWARSLEAVPEGASVTVLEGWLKRVDGSTWETWIEQAVADDRREAERQRVEAALAVAQAEAVRATIAHERALVTEEEASKAAEAELRKAAARAAATQMAEQPWPGALEALRAGPSAARAAYRRRKAAEAALHSVRERLGAHLLALDAKDLAGLRLAVEEVGHAVATARLAWSSWVEEHQGLPPAELPGPDPRALVATARQASEQAREAAAAADQAYLEAQARLVRVQGNDPVDIAAAEIEAREVEAEVERITFERDALAMALRELVAAAEAYQEAHGQRLADTASDYFRRFSGVPGRRIELDAGFKASVREPSGDLASPAQLSQGAQDQLALALRLAIADLLATELRLPLVFDDPFLNWDEDRLLRLRQVLDELAEERQLIVLSHRDGLSGWGRSVRRQETTASS